MTAMPFPSSLLALRLLVEGIASLFPLRSTCSQEGAYEGGLTHRREGEKKDRNRQTHWCSMPSTWKELEGEEVAVLPVAGCLP